MTCHGNGQDHCCWVHGQVCEYLEENTVPGRRWACGLRRELGSWDFVHADSRYLALPVAAWHAEHTPGHWCGDYPQNIPGLLDTPGINRCCWSEG